MTQLFVLISENTRPNKPIEQPSRVMSGQLCLNCWIVNDGTGSIFPVDIAGTKTVGHLKKAIKAEKPVAFQHVDPDALVLWKVSVHGSNPSRITPELRQVNIPDDDNLPEAVADLRLDTANPLRSVKRLSKLFEEALPADENVHIVIRRPPNGVFRHLPLRFLR